MLEKNYDITGMRSEDCAVNIENALRELEGVISVYAGFTSNSLNVVFNENVIAGDGIISAVRRAGYGAVLKKKALVREITIDGMNEESDSDVCRRLVHELDGVISADIDFVAKKALIEYDASAIKLVQIIKTLKTAGYEVEESKSKKSEPIKKNEQKAIVRELIIAVFASVVLLYLSMGHLLQLHLPLPKIVDIRYSPFAFAWVQFVLTSVVLLAGWRFYVSGFKSIIKALPNMDALVAIGTACAFLNSVYAMAKIAAGSSGYIDRLFFESAAFVIVLILVGKYLENITKERSSDAVRKLTELAPGKAHVQKCGEFMEIETAELETGDLVIVNPGESFPCDGIVESGVSVADNSMITGESLPVPLSADSAVTGGAVNGEGRIKFRATGVGEDTALCRIIRMVEEAQNKKAPIAMLADSVISWFVPLVIVIAIISATVWFLTGKSVEFVLNIFVSVLVIACPCALGLATPASIIAGTNRAAGIGILFKSGEALQSARYITHIVLDKTGTITNGKPSVIRISPAKQLTGDQLLTLAACAETGLNHPVARAITAQANLRHLEPIEAQEITAFPGMGVEAIINESVSVLLGNAMLMNERGIDISQYSEEADEITKSGAAVLYCIVSGKHAGYIVLSDTLKDDSIYAVDLMHRLGLRVTMLTGDNENAAEKIASQTHIDSVIAGILPGRKAGEIYKLRESGYKVAMVGDGINDAPALAAADVGIAIGTGTDVAIESAQIVLMSGSLKGVSDAIAISRATIRNIKQNLFWAFIYNCIGIFVATGMLYAFGGPLLNPIISGAAMALGSMCVVINSFRLKFFKL